MENRIEAKYKKMKEQIEKRIEDGLTTIEKAEKCGCELDMELQEYCKFQELKSLAVASRILTLEEGMTIYTSLGETVETFNSQPIHVKVVLTQLFAELLSQRIGGKVHV